jgi:hypothetical protein
MPSSGMLRGMVSFYMGISANPIIQIAVVDLVCTENSAFRELASKQMYLITVENKENCLCKI